MGSISTHIWYLNYFKYLPQGPLTCVDLHDLHRIEWSVTQKIAILSKEKKTHYHEHNKTHKNTQIQHNFIKNTSHVT